MFFLDPNAEQYQDLKHKRGLKIYRSFGSESSKLDRQQSELRAMQKSQDNLCISTGNLF